MRRNLPPEFRAQASHKITQQLLALDFFQRADLIHTYVAWRDEVDNHALLHEMLRHGKRVIVPKIIPGDQQLEHFLITHWDCLVPGAFGILEPSVAHGAVPFHALASIALILVPGLAFDRQGERLGYGGGYYDRLLAQMPATKVALAFAAQVLTSVPGDAHDERVDYVVTEEEVIACAPR